MIGPLESTRVLIKWATGQWDDLEDDTRRMVEEVGMYRMPPSKHNSCWDR